METEIHKQKLLTARALILRLQTWIWIWYFTRASLTETREQQNSMRSFQMNLNSR